MDSLAPIREGEIQVKFNIRSAGEIVGGLDLEWRGICASRVNDHVRITRAGLHDGDTCSRCRERGGNRRLFGATVVLDTEVQFHAFGPVNDAVVGAEGESSIVKPFASSFDVPVIAKFWITAPGPPGGATMG